MASEDAPEESGTNEEQHENDIAVEATDEVPDPVDAPEQEREGDGQGMAGEMEEIQERLASIDPANIGAISVVVCTKNPMESVDCEAENGGSPDGFSWRVINASLEGYDDVNDVVAALAAFNSGLEDAQVEMERGRPSGPAGLLGDLLGGR